MKKIMIVFGTRPEAIKMAPIIERLRNYKDMAKMIVVSTSQHKEMLSQIIKLFDIEVDYDLDIMQDNQSLFDIVSNSLKKFEKIMQDESPDIVLVQGDTTTTFTACLSAYFSKIPVAHIEAGLRTHDKYSPFPEEINRRLVSPMADIHFAPTKMAFNNLVKENINRENIFITGNTVIDSLLSMVNKNEPFGHIHEQKLLHQLKRIDFKKRVILLTAHRRESFGEPFEDMCLAVEALVKNNKDIEVVYPVHLNPNVQNVVHRILKNHSRIHLIPTLDYKTLVQIMKKCYLILTDSGGIQEEAPSLGKPVLVLRENTERPEAIGSGVAKLVGTDKASIIREVELLLNDQQEYQRMSQATNPYGDGQAAERIVNCIFGLPFNEFNPHDQEQPVQTAESILERIENYQTS